MILEWKKKSEQWLLLVEWRQGLKEKGEKNKLELKLKNKK